MKPCNAPVVIFTYKREKHFRQTTEALSRCTLSKETDVYIFIDGPRSGQDREKVQAIREYAESLESKNWFGSLHIEASEQNKGLSASVIGGVDKIINKYGKIIVLEDDIIVKNNFLEFMNGALTYFQNKGNVWAVSSYTPELKILETVDDFIYANCRANCWGWASWADRWNTIDWQIKDYKEFVFCHKKRKAFNQGGNDLSRMLDAYMAGDIDSWAVRWNYAQHKAQMVAVAPRISLSRNAGFDGSGENCGKVSLEHYEDRQLDIGRFHEVEPEQDIQKELKRYYDSLYSVKLRVKKQITSLIRRIRWYVGIKRRSRII